MTEEIMPGLYRIPVPLEGNPLKELNAYLIRGKRSILIDTGFRRPSCRLALSQGLKELGIRMGEVDVLLTHLHSDHSGLAPEAAEKGVIYISQTDRPALEDMAYRELYWNRMDSRFRQEGFPRELMAKMRNTNPAYSMAPPEGGRYESLKEGDVLEAGDYRLECLLMPGHTPGQMCFWIREAGVMFTGDHVLFDITPNITSWINMPDALGAYLESLERIRTYPATLSLPGHRKGGDLHKRVEELLSHHRKRLEEAFENVKSQPGSGAYQLAGWMKWKIRANSWEEFPVAQKWFAVGECMSHLDHLIAQGKIERRILRGRAAYFPKG